MLRIHQACIGATTRMFAPDSKNCHHARKSSRDADVVESVSEPIDVLVDSIIGFLDQSTAYLRSVANQAFSLLSSAVQKTTIELILTVSSHESFCSVTISRSIF
jgi:DNA polymerase phi